MESMYQRFEIIRCPICRRPLGEGAIAQILDLPVQPVIEVREARGKKGLPIVEKFTLPRYHPYYVSLKKRYDLISPYWEEEKIYPPNYEAFVRPVYKVLTDE